MRTIKDTSIVTNQKLAQLLRKVAAVYAVTGENRFRTTAYENAATAIEHSTSEVKDLWDDGKLETLPGLGDTIIGHLDELFHSGKVKHWNKVFQKVPETMFTLLDIPGIGPKRAYTLVTHLNLSNKNPVKDLLKNIQEHKVCSIPGFGEKSENDILGNIRLWQKRAQSPMRMLLSDADILADKLVGYLSRNSDVEEAIPLGSLRRRVATVGDIDIAVRTIAPKSVVDKFLTYPGVQKVIEQGKSGVSVVLSNQMSVDIRVCHPSCWGSMLQYFTGSKYHNIKLRELAIKIGLSLSEYGIKSKGVLEKYSTEEAFYERLGLDYVPPELREDTGEILVAKNKVLPDLITLADVCGDLQTHSNYNVEPSHDLGEDSMEEMARVANKLGYKYLAFTEHNPSRSQHTTERIEEILKGRQEYIEKLNDRVRPLKLINGLEVDIAPDGSLNLPKKAFEYVDLVLASVHSSFHLPKEQMTRRVLKALSYPKVKIFAHPTGRMLNRREGYELDWEVIFQFCQKKNIAVEINAQPSRLDLPDTLVRQAISTGVLLSLGTDSHAAKDFSLMRYGIDVARRGWARKSDVINCWPYDRIINWIRS